MENKPILKEVPDINRTLLWLVLKFLVDNMKDGVVQRKLYVYPKDLHYDFPVPDGKVVQVTFNLVSEKKLRNEAE